ncbi:outer dynein arm-docking complex subunit 4-like isoform X2 [Tachypleus tridentatus]|uniref:outer dynein arm-docking complex subunit 4-like isoform X2 n=1 Tax=Tachypleus tridentatus TaxID=6853 RepID=UPI003FD40A46
MLPEPPRINVQNSNGCNSTNVLFVANPSVRDNSKSKLVKCSRTLEPCPNVETPVKERVSMLNIEKDNQKIKKRLNLKDLQSENPTSESTFSSLSIDFNGEEKRRESISSEPRSPRSPRSPTTKQRAVFKKSSLFISQQREGDLNSDKNERTPIEGGTCALEDFKKNFSMKDEFYTDKDRAASVAFGSKDIKASLQDKEEREIRKMKPGEKKSIICLTQGEHEIRQGNAKSAVQFFNKALDLHPTNKDCLIARSKCYLQLGNSEAALRDAETALGEDKDCVRALYQKAEALFTMGNFEYALVFYHRGHKLRPEIEEFKLGIQKSQKAIDNSIGKEARIKLGTKRESSSKRGKASRCHGNLHTSLLTEEHKNTKLLLGELSVDKMFIEKLLKNKDLTRTVQPKSKEVCEHAQDAFDFLQSRQIFWHQQKPLYAREHHRRFLRTHAQSGGNRRGNIVSQHDRFGKAEEKRKQQKDQEARKKVIKQVMKMLEEIDSVLYSEQYQKCLDRGKALTKFLDKCPEEHLPNKAEILASVYSNIGSAHMESGDLESALQFHQKDLELGEQYNLEESRSRAMDNIGRIFALRHELDKAIEVWEMKIPLCSLAIEKTWLHHELGRCYLELNEHIKAKEYGKKSLEYASEAKDVVWQLNSSVLIGQAEVLGGNLEKALEAFDVALRFARQHKDGSIQRAVKLAQSKILKQIEEFKEAKTPPMSEKKMESSSNISKPGKDNYGIDNIKTSRDVCNKKLNKKEDKVFV